MQQQPPPSHDTAESLRDVLQAGFPGRIASLTINDESGGCGAKFSLILVSDHFEGMPLLDRQKLVNKILAEPLARIHALQMKTWTTAQWEKATSGNKS